jgi:hypothetical protein
VKRLDEKITNRRETNQPTIPGRAQQPNTGTSRRQKKDESNK